MGSATNLVDKNYCCPAVRLEVYIQGNDSNIYSRFNSMLVRLEVYFSNTERQGPGSREETLKAFSFIDGHTENSKIADIGCGTGLYIYILTPTILKIIHKL